MNVPSPKPMFVLATRARHTLAMFGPPVEREAMPEIGRRRQIERICDRCNCVRVIVLCRGGGGFLAWRASPDAIEQVLEEPECVSDEEIMGRVGT